MSDTFNTYGYSFQIKLLAALFKNKTFLQQVSDILDSNYFESDSNKWIANTVINYFNEYKSSPTLEVMKVNIDSVDNEVLKTAIVDTLKEVMKNIDAEDMDFVQDETLKFCKNQKLKGAIMESVNLLQRGDYDGIKHKIDDALKAEMKAAKVSLFKNFDEGKNDFENDMVVE